MTSPAALRPTLDPRPLLTALYVVALAFILPSLLEFLLVSFPYRLGAAQWRFGAVGLLFNSVLFSPIIGLLIATFAAVQLGQRRAARTAAVVAFVLAALLLIAAPFFVLDFLQLRASVNPQSKRAFDFASAKAGITGGIMFLSTLAIGIGAWRAVPRAGKPAAVRSARPAGNVVVGGSVVEASQHG